ncbi:hypothetical protein BC567DRAFT_229241, partial [Phyllosticta citribraziliensis]
MDGRDGEVGTTLTRFWLAMSLSVSCAGGCLAGTGRLAGFSTHCTGTGGRWTSQSSRPVSVRSSSHHLPVHPIHPSIHPSIQPSTQAAAVHICISAVL